MELRQLQYFVAVADELHFGRAAERLHIVPAAVTQQIQRLERELGTALFDRSSRRVALTTAGQQLLPEARSVLDAMRRLRDRMIEFADTQVQTMRIGTSSGLGARLGQLLAALRVALPDVDVELVRTPADRRLAQVADGDLDAALIRGTTTAPGVSLHHVWDDPILAAVPAGLFDRHTPLTLHALRELPLRLPARDTNPPLVDLVLAACRASGFEPTLAEALNDQDMLAAIGSGPSSWTVYYEPQARIMAAASRDVVFRPIDEPPLVMATTLVTPIVCDQSHDALLAAACRSRKWIRLLDPERRDGILVSPLVRVVAQGGASRRTRTPQLALRKESDGSGVERDRRAADAFAQRRFAHRLRNLVRHVAIEHRRHDERR